MGETDTIRYKLETFFFGIASNYHQDPDNMEAEGQGLTDALYSLLEQEGYEIGPAATDGETRDPLSFETAAEVYEYLASRGETLERHEHLWVEWPWGEGMYEPHQGRSQLYVCNVPKCIAVRTEPVVPDEST